MAPFATIELCQRAAALASMTHLQRWRSFYSLLAALLTVATALVVERLAAAL